MMRDRDTEKVVITPRAQLGQRTWSLKVESACGPRLLTASKPWPTCPLGKPQETEEPAGLRVTLCKVSWGHLPGWSCLLWKARLPSDPTARPPVLTMCAHRIKVCWVRTQPSGGHTCFRGTLSSQAQRQTGYYAEHHLLWGHACPLAPSAD